MNTSTLQKSLIAAFILAFALWFGGGIIRNSIAFDVFLPGTLDVKPFLKQEQINYSLRLLGVTGYYTVAGYALAFFSLSGLLMVFRKQLKSQGWMFMSFILFYLCSPVEFYQMWIDLKLIFRTNAIDFVSLMRDDGLFTLFKERFHPWMTAASFITLLSYLTALLFLAWQPLKTQKQADIH